MASTAEASPYTTRPGYPQSASPNSGSQQQNFKQNSNNGKVPFGNGSNENNEMGPDGNGNYGDDNDDGDEDDWGIQGTTTTTSGHCVCCPYSRSKHPTGSRQPTPLVVAGAASLKFACPYFKHNPNNHLEGSCKGPGWSDVSRVKEHIYRRHFLPIRCPRCGNHFDDDTLLSTHLQQVVACDRRELEELEGCSKEQEKHLRSRKGIRGRKDVDRWRDVYSTLFPNVPPPDIPSPYHLIPHVEASIVLEITRSFSQFFKDKFSKRFANEYGATTVPNLGEIVDKHTNTILREYQQLRKCSDAASQNSFDDTSSTVSSRKKLRPNISPPMGSGTTTIISHPDHFEHQPQPTNPNLPSRPCDTFMQQTEATNDSFPSGSSTSQRTETSEFALSVEKDNLVIQPPSPFSAAPQTGKGIEQNHFDLDPFVALSEQDLFAMMGGQDPIVYGVPDNEAMAPGGNQSIDMEIGIGTGFNLDAHQQF